jgi:transcriptional regulator with XRE-family HTH domain
MDLLICNIDECIKKIGYRRDHVADHFGITTQQLSNWCKMRSYPKTPTLYELAAFLKCTANDLYTYKEDEK